MYFESILIFGFDNFSRGLYNTKQNKFSMKKHEASSYGQGVVAQKATVQQKPKLQGSSFVVWEHGKKTHKTSRSQDVVVQKREVPNEL